MVDGEECDAVAYSHQLDMHPWLGSPERYSMTILEAVVTKLSLSLSEHAHRGSFFQNSDISSKCASR